jgi:hypothetical protein
MRLNEIKQVVKEMAATVDGKTVKVGDWVHFKSDVEQAGKIKKITVQNGRVMLHLHKDHEGFSGGYIGGQNDTVEDARDCWLESVQEKEETDPYMLGHGHFKREWDNKPHPQNPHTPGTPQAAAWQREYDKGKRDREDDFAGSRENDYGDDREDD